MKSLENKRFKILELGKAPYSNHLSIISVKRLSDEKIFKIGDLINDPPREIEYFRLNCTEQNIIVGLKERGELWLREIFLYKDYY